MDSTVRQRPNHYETLGLSPEATGDDIAQAFARELRRTRPFGEINQVGIAHEVLRDPAKRRAYDESLGLNEKPEPAPRQDTPTPIATTRRTVFATAPMPVPQRDSRPSADSAPERTVGSFIASSLRTPADPHVDEAAAESPPPPEPTPKSEVEPAAMPVRQERTEFKLAPNDYSDAEDGQIPWKRIGIGTGAMIIAGGLLGVWAGPRAEVEASPSPQTQAVTLSLPEAKPSVVAMSDAAAEPPPAYAPERFAPAARRPDAGGQRSEAERLPSIQAMLDDAPARTATDLAQTTEPSAGDAIVPDAQAPVVAASMPLPNGVIARTIHQIGYSCGSVTSATAVEGGAPGVFKVNCSSGTSYRASPVRGRYHFRRWGRS